MTLYEELKWRGLIKDEAGDDLKDKLDNEKITFQPLQVPRCIMPEVAYKDI